MRPGCQRKRAQFCTVFGRIRKTAPQAHVGPVVAATAEPDPAPPPRGLKHYYFIGFLWIYRIRARPCPTSEGIETANLHPRTLHHGDSEPDPAPPPRGLKL